MKEEATAPKPTIVGLSVLQPGAAKNGTQRPALAQAATPTPLGPLARYVVTRAGDILEAAMIGEERPG